MMLLAFAVFDEKTEVFSAPFFQVANGQAIRTFTDACSDGESQYAKHPSDYKLYRVGAFDDNEGKLISESPTLLTSGSEIVQVNSLKVV